MAETVFYGDLRKTPDKFLGIAPRFRAEVCGERREYLKRRHERRRGDEALERLSRRLVGNDTVHGIFRRGRRRGSSTKTSAARRRMTLRGGRYMAYKGHYTWRMGLCVRDWRYIVRIAIIDLDTLAVGITLRRIS